MWFLGIDVGTTHVKVVGVTEDGTVLPAARRRTPVLTLGGYAYHDGAAVWAEIADLAAEYATTTAAGRGGLRGVSVGSFGQEESLAVDAAGAVVTPTLAWWQTPPGSALDAEVRAYLDSPEHYAVSGMRYRAIQSPERIAALRAERPDAWRRTRRYVDFISYVTWQLSGRWRASSTQITHSQVFELDTLAPHRPSLDALTLTPDLFGPVGRPGEVVDALRPDALPGVPLAPDATVYLGAHDQVLALYAVAAGTDRAVFDSIGTSEYLMVRAPRFAPDDVAYRLGMDYEHAWRAGEYLLGHAVTSGKVVQLLAELFCGGDFDRLYRALATDVAVPEPVRLRVSDLSRPGAGLISLADIPADATPAGVVRACLDQLADTTRGTIARMCEVAGVELGEVTLMGSQFRRDEMLAHRRARWQLPLHRADAGEPVATGAALLARDAAAGGLR